MVLRGIHEKDDICQTDYTVYSKLRIFPYSEVIYRSITFKLTKDKQRLKKSYQLLSVMYFFFHFLCSSVPDNKCHIEEWCVLVRLNPANGEDWSVKRLLNPLFKNQHSLFLVSPLFQRIPLQTPGQNQENGRRT